MAGAQEKQLRWYNIALMSFITVWGFGNVVNNYANQGLVVVFHGCLFLLSILFLMPLSSASLGLPLKMAKAVSARG